ncbi:heme exporter protein CcmD [Aquibaculum sediminis]|uniref:heme exporter protein CcmD n=1 Tax=Aquibaculum sediminis TaxID=3231907 RepID=UPI00345719AC
MSGYLAMGGYALYVWGSYALTALVLGLLFFGARQGLKRRERELDSLRALAPHRRQRTGSEKGEGA